MSDDDAVFLRALGHRVRVLRVMNNLTQAELGNRAGVSRSFVSLIEKGLHGIEIVRLRHLATALGVPLPRLLDPQAPLIDPTA